MSPAGRVHRWPAVGLHVILTILLAWVWLKECNKLEQAQRNNKTSE